MPERSEDWINQARRDLESAESMLEDEIFEWSCFVYFTKGDAEDAIFCSRKFTDRIEEWLGRFFLDFPVEVFPYAEEEHNPVVEEAIKKGVVMFERM